MPRLTFCTSLVLSLLLFAAPVLAQKNRTNAFIKPRSVTTSTKPAARPVRDDSKVTTTAVRQPSILRDLSTIVASVFSRSANETTTLNIDATTFRATGGVLELDRAVYFNHWGHHNTNTPLDDLVTSTSAFHSVTGRETFELDVFVAGDLMQDPGNPGFFQDADLQNQLQTVFRDWTLNGDRWGSLREYPNPIFVQSGRATNWPGFMLPMDGATIPVANDGQAYAQLLTAYAEEVLFGSGANQSFLPFDPNRHYFEIMNEPQLELDKPFAGAVTWDEVIQMHQTATETVKAAFPQVKIGGASVGDALTGPHRWSLMRDMMDDMTTWNAEFDFWTIHPYECYRVNDSQQPAKITFHSPAHLNGLLDLFEATSNQLFGEPKQFAVTEYGMWAFTQLADNGFGSYTRDERQWDHVRDTKEKLMEFLRRPDRIINATPFINIQHFTLNSPSDPDGFYHFFDRQSDGSYIETIIGNMYRMFNDVNGSFVMCEKDNVNTQATAVLDGNELHVLLNNMERMDNEVSLNLNIGTSSVTSAKISRIWFDGTKGVYEDEVDVTNSWQSITLKPDEGTVLTLTLDSSVLFCGTRFVEAEYAQQTETPIPNSGFVGPFDFFGLDTTDMQKATFRVSFSRPSAALGEAFNFFINGTQISVAATGDIGYDDGDRTLGSREVEVPVDLIQDGQNQIFVGFPDGGGGQLLAVTADFEYQPGVIGDLPVVDSVVVNEGDVQRSMVREIEVAFSEIVDVNADSFIVENVDTNATFVPDVATEVVSNATVATLTFSGTGIVGGSLPDGNYTLTTLGNIPDADGNKLDGNGDGSPGDSRTDEFYRFYGDTNADRTVNVFDLLTFRQAYEPSGIYNAAVDYNGDGAVNVFDLLQFRIRFRTSLDD